MAIRTLNQIVGEFQEIANQHRQINNFTVGTLEDFATSGTTNYPAWWVGYDSNAFASRTEDFTFKFWLVDRVKKDRSNLIEIHSDLKQVAMDIIAQLNDSGYGWRVSESVNLSAIYEPFHEDEVAGWSFDFTISQPFTKDVCQIPFIEPIAIGRSQSGYNPNTPLTYYVPVTRTITIDGVTYDLSADRTWTTSGTTSTSGVTSVGLSMPSAFNVTNSPITGAGNLTVTGAGLDSQYIRGDGSLANFPDFGGGGASTSFYLNGGTNQGTFEGNTYYQLSNSAVVNSPATFNISSDGYIAQFITDINKPSQLNIPSGNWNFEMYMSSSSSGGTPSFYVELYKYDGSSFTLIASNNLTPEGITNGTVTDLYTTSLAVPTTILNLTDRLAIRIYVNNSGRTITLHTQDGTLCQIITTFTTGLTALNGLTTQIQTFATGTSGTDFNINSSGSIHNFNIPDASSTKRGLLTSADWTTFNNKASQDTFTIRMAIGPASPADGATYYFADAAAALNSNPILYLHRFAYNCKLIGASIFIYNSSINATNETSTINFRLNNTTDVLLSNSIIFGGTVPTSKSYYITGLNQNINANDTGNIKWTTPTWVTNPTGAFFAINLYLQRL